MATHTIEIDSDAYSCLERARRDQSESESQIIKRAKWDDRSNGTGQEILDALRSASSIDCDLVYLNLRQFEDSQPHQ